MRHWIGGPSIRVTSLLMIFGASSLVVANDAVSQGCMPSRFSSPVVGSKGDVYLPKGAWQLGATFRRTTSAQRIIGHTAYDFFPAGVLPTAVDVKAVDVSATYGISNQLSVSVDLPFATGSHTTRYADVVRHENTATGAGDLSVVANYWLGNAAPLHPAGNFALGLGVKAPTGKNDAAGKFWSADGTGVTFPVHPSIELGDGGWGMIMQAQGFQPVGSIVYLYASGSYIANPQKVSSVTVNPTSTVHWAIPDSWAAKAGAAVALWPEHGLSASLGVRFDGTPQRDLIGGSDSGNRLPARVGYADPGVTFNVGATTLSLSVPIRIYYDFPPSNVDLAAGAPGGGGLSKYQVIASYAVRF